MHTPTDPVMTGDDDAETSSASVIRGLRQSNADLAAFASVAAHDLQEPLRKIRTFGARLGGTTGTVLGADGLDYLRRMQASADRMQVLIDDLLSYARVPSRVEPFQSVDLQAIVADVASDLEDMLDRSHGRLAVGPLPTIAGDPTQLRQLFQNLLGNALKFAAPERSPVVEVRVAERSAAHDVTIEVRDNGIGFEPAYAERIFEPLQRLHGRSQYEGTGIGLAICRRIAERHGGSISAASVPGVGSRFSIVLPVGTGDDQDRRHLDDGRALGRPVA